MFGKLIAGIFSIFAVLSTATIPEISLNTRNVGFTVNNDNSYTGLYLDSIKELSNDTVVKEYNLSNVHSQWNVSQHTLHNQTSCINYVNTLSITNQDNTTSTLQLDVLQCNTSNVLEYGSYNYMFLNGDVKFTLDVKNWLFNNTNNILSIGFKLLGMLDSLDMFTTDILQSMLKNTGRKDEMIKYYSMTYLNSPMFYIDKDGLEKNMSVNVINDTVNYLFDSGDLYYDPIIGSVGRMLEFIGNVDSSSSSSSTGSVVDSSSSSSSTGIVDSSSTGSVVDSSSSTGIVDSSSSTGIVDSSSTGSSSSGDNHINKSYNIRVNNILYIILIYISVMFS